MTQVKLWGYPDPYFSEMDVFATELLAAFPNAEIKTAAYSGGVAGMSAKLPYDKYRAVDIWLSQKFGASTITKSWHPSHTKGCDPLTFTIHQIRPIRPDGNAGIDVVNKIDHVHLISMMQRKDKRYTLVTWM